MTRQLARSDRELRGVVKLGDVEGWRGMLEVQLLIADDRYREFSLVCGMTLAASGGPWIRPVTLFQARYLSTPNSSSTDSSTPLGQDFIELGSMFERTLHIIGLIANILFCCLLRTFEKPPSTQTVPSPEPATEVQPDFTYRADLNTESNQEGMLLPKSPLELGFL